MDNAFGEPQVIVVLGGTSDIGLAIARRLLSPVAHVVVLGCRDVDRGEQAAASLRADNVKVEVVHYDAADTGSHEKFISEVAGAHGDIDVAILAAGQLGDGESTGSDVDAAVRLAQVNFTGGVSSSIAVANRLRTQGHGTLIVLSSVAGERVRKANFVYGATKAGLDGFAQGLGDSLVGTGAKVLVVRPGFVHSAMTKGMKAAPFATTPDKVAEVVFKGFRSGRRTVWAPGILRVVFSILRHLPGPVWRRLPLG
jgi:decaprenylphospho-beta-D-erythro-pentofuranosid-2-ulose 2-reductase